MTVTKKPNVLIILADDLGFSDVGCFGGEIETPNIDKLAAQGTRLTDFHTASACSPTRAMLLSGTDHHVAGLGTMAERLTEKLATQPGYEGFLNDRVVSLQECLRDGGYETLMSGKWHLGNTPDRVPSARGFDRSFALLNGCHNHYGYEPSFEDRCKVPRIEKVMGRMYYKDNTPMPPSELPRDFYSSDSFTDTLLDYLRDRDGRGEARPFFAYLPFSAPHWPLQAPREIIDKYRGVYDDGPEALRQRRLAALKRLGLVPEKAVAAPVVAIGEDGKETKDWETMSAEERAASARTMEAYAAMVDRMDWNIGRIVDHLQETQQLDNTIVMFFSDNGAEGAQFEAWPITSGGDMGAHVEKYYNNALENIGSPDSFVWYGPRWASASTAPGLLFKMFTSEGGIRVPFVIRHPSLVKQASIDHSFATVMDILPTVLDMCGVPHPGTTYKGREVASVMGKSWLPYLRGDEAEIHGADHVTGWELFGRRAIRQGSWKALYIQPPFGSGKWQLFNILDDPGETRDLAQEQPERTQVMIDLYSEYCKANGVVT